MTAPVIDLAAARLEREPHSAGRARCLDCRHEWEAVAPLEVQWLECPACSLQRGRFVAQHQREGRHWVCTCGNELFAKHETDGWYCPNCGQSQFLE